MATQPKVGSLQTMVMTKHVPAVQTSCLYGLALVSDAEGSSNDEAGDVSISSVRAMVLEKVISKTTVNNFFGLALISAAEIVIPEATGQLLSQAQV